MQFHFGVVGLTEVKHDESERQMSTKCSPKSFLDYQTAKVARRSQKLTLSFYFLQIPNTYIKVLTGVDDRDIQISKRNETMILISRPATSIVANTKFSGFSFPMHRILVERFPVQFDRTPHLSR